MYDIYDTRCPQCEVGRWKLTYTTYTQMFDGQVLSAPDLPMYVCDVCGYQEFDSEALLDIQLLTGQLDTNPEEDPPQPRRNSNIDLNATASQSKKP